MNKKNKMISLSAVGPDAPGLVAGITTKIFEMEGNVIDVEESCRRGLFSIFLIIDFAKSIHAIGDIVRQLKGIGEKAGLKTMVETYDPVNVRRPTEKENHIVTVLGVDQPGIIAKISTFFHNHNVNIENCRMIALGTFFSMEMEIDTIRMRSPSSRSHAEAVEKMNDALKAECKKMDLSVVIQSEDLYKKAKKLVVFDVESSLIRESSLKGFLDKIKGNVKSMKPGDIMKNNSQDEMQALIRNAKSLKGIPLRDFEKFGKILQLNPGALELIRILKSMGFKIALLSSGFSFFLKDLFEAAGVDYAFSNTLVVDESGIATGQLEEPVITTDNKNEILDFIMDVEDIQRDQIIAVGDGSTHSHYIKNVGLSIAFKPDELRVETDGILSSDQIINMLYCLGIPKTDLEPYFKDDSA